MSNVNLSKRRRRAGTSGVLIGAGPLDGSRLLVEAQVELTDCTDDGTGFFVRGGPTGGKIPGKHFSSTGRWVGEGPVSVLSLVDMVAADVGTMVPRKFVGRLAVRNGVVVLETKFRLWYGSRDVAFRFVCKFFVVVVVFAAASLNPFARSDSNRRLERTVDGRRRNALVGAVVLVDVVLLLVCGSVGESTSLVEWFPDDGGRRGTRFGAWTPLPVLLLVRCGDDDDAVAAWDPYNDRAIEGCALGTV
jgi:hypothetical protein